MPLPGSSSEKVTLLQHADSPPPIFSPHLLSAAGLQSRSLSVSVPTLHQVYPSELDGELGLLEPRAIELSGLKTAGEGDRTLEKGSSGAEGRGTLRRYSRSSSSPAGGEGGGWWRDGRSSEGGDSQRHKLEAKLEWRTAKRSVDSKVAIWEGKTDRDDV